MSRRPDRFENALWTRVSESPGPEKPRLRRSPLQRPSENSADSCLPPRCYHPAHIMRHILLVSSVLVMLAVTVPHGQVNPSYFGGLKWRSIGPPRSGYISAPAGVPGDPTTYYAGMPEGGVWKTTNGGTTWRPIFDDVHVASIGAVAVAPSNPNVVYVGTGNQSGWSFTTGKGIYKSTDAGKTWTSAGLASS